VIHSGSLSWGLCRVARRLLPGVVLPLALCAAVLGGPVSQLLLISETRATCDAPHARYELVVSAGLPALKQKKDCGGAPAKTAAPRLLKVLTDHWDSHGGIAYPVADAPAWPAPPWVESAVMPRAGSAQNAEPRRPPAGPQVLSRPPPGNYGF
jgi:hypothetical protein